MAIQAPGVGSGLDVNGIVTKLMAIERQPINRLNSKQSIVNAQISAYGSLKSKISDFQTAMTDLSSASSFKVFSGVSNDQALFTVNVDSAATAGSYNVDVVALAERDKISTKAYTDSATFVGEGTLTLSTGANSFNVVIDPTNNTVSGIRDAINNASGNTGVTASIVTDNNGVQLVLSSSATGTANALKIVVSDTTDGNNTDDLGLSSLAFEAGVVSHRANISTAKDAVVKIDGFTVNSSSNTITGAVQGLTINAKAIGVSSVDISRDDTKITASVQKFADAYNALRTEINTQRKGQLEADSTLLTIERQLSGILNSGSTITGSNFSYVSQVGLTTDSVGKMTLNTADLTNVLNTDFSSFVNLFSAPNEGIAAKLKDYADGVLATDGLIDARKTGLDNQVSSIDDQKLRLENRLVSIERRIRAQFSALDTLVSSLQSTGNFLSQQLAALPGVGR